MASAGKAKKSGGRSTQASVFNRHPLTVLMLASGMMPGWSLANDITLHTALIVTQLTPYTAPTQKD